MTQNKLLKAKDLCVTFSQKSGLFNLKSTHLKAVDGVSFDLCKNEFLALVGESGSGKSTLGQAIAGLCPLTSGQLELFDQTLDLSDQNQWKSLRHQIQMIFQDFNGALNPRLNRNIECGGHFVTNQYLRLYRKGARKINALSLTPRKLMRITSERINWEHDLI